MSVHTNAFALEQAGNPESKVDQNLALFQNSLNTIPLAPEENPNFYLNEGHTILITAVGGSLPDIRIYTPADFQYFEMIGDTLTS
jgi:hypothetical protein